MKYSRNILFGFISLFLSFSSLSQDMKWDWIRQNAQMQASTWTFIMNCDSENNYYTASQYSDSIYFGDTLFAHTGYEYYDWVNWAIAKYNDVGQFQGAIDITTEPWNILLGVNLITDDNMNMYIVSQFQKSVNILDTTILQGSTPSFNDPELFIAKISPSFKIEWIRLISSASAEDYEGFIIMDNYLYLITLHYGNGGSLDTVNYFGQDTAICNNTLCSLLKIDLNGNLVWRKKLYSDQFGMNIRNLISDNFGNLLIFGSTKNNIVYYNDTLFHPHPYEYLFRPFLLTIDTSGNLSSGKIFDWSIYMGDVKPAVSNHLYFAGSVWGIAYFAGDTIVQHEDSSVNIIAKLDMNYEPVWYKTTKSSDAQGSYYFYIDTYEDTLFFAGRCNNTLHIFDTTFNLGASNEIVIGKVLPDGNLDKLIYTNSIGGASPYGLMMDNCNNILISGRLKGRSIFGQDTLYSYNPAFSDGFLSKICRFDPCTFDLGPDTTVYDSITITGPPGFQYYYWNDSLSGQSLVVTETGEYTLACVNDNGCWVRDTINITVLITVPELQNIDVSAYPNPAGDFIYILSKKSIDRIEICDIHGKTVLTKSYKDILTKPVTIYISDIPQGVYYLTVTMQETTGIVKIIKI